MEEISMLLEKDVDVLGGLGRITNVEDNSPSD
jgi:hypothetical protein